MENLRITNTGIPFLDSLMGGGFLSNSSIVFSLQSGVKFWEFVHRIAHKNYEEKSHLIVVLYHLSQPQVLDQLKFSPQSAEHYKEAIRRLSTEMVSTIDCFSIHEGEKRDSQKGNAYYVSNPFNTDSLLSAMSNARNSIPKDKSVFWIFSTLTDMSIGLPEDEVLKFCRRVFRYQKQNGDLAIYLLNEYAHSDKFFAKIYQLSDVFIKLIAEETPWGLENGIQVIKGVFPFQSKRFFYDVNEKGEIIFRTSKMDTKPEMPPITFSTTKNLEGESYSGGEHSNLIRTGIPKLDSLLGGGMLTNSLVIFSHQYGIRIIEPLHHIFQNAIRGKTHVIQISYNFLLEEYLSRFKLSERQNEPIKEALETLSQGNVSFIDCLNVQKDETNTQGHNVYHLSNPFDVDKILSLMTKVRDSIPSDKSVLWVFSSLTDMSIGIPEDELLKFCRRAFRYHKKCGDIAIYLMVEQAHSEIFHAKLYILSDVFIKFIVEDVLEGKNTRIQILKSSFNYDSKKTKYILDEKGRIQFLED
ncbi:MAG: hypothetical protein WED07_14705 [Candidatus Freyarchaeum deiterrae]